MRCPSCGREASPGDRFCAGCGAAFPELSSADYRSRIDVAVDVFEEGEIARARELMQEELDRIAAVGEEVALVYLVDVLRQMVDQLEDDEQVELYDLLEDDGAERLRRLQAGRLGPRLEEARRLFSEHDLAGAIEILYQEMLAAPTVEPDRITLWRVLAVAGDMYADAETDEMPAFEFLRTSVCRRLETSSPPASAPAPPATSGQLDPRIAIRRDDF